MQIPSDEPSVPEKRYEEFSPGGRRMIDAGMGAMRLWRWKGVLFIIAGAIIALLAPHGERLRVIGIATLIGVVVLLWDLLAAGRRTTEG